MSKTKSHTKEARTLSGIEKMLFVILLILGIAFLVVYICCLHDNKFADEPEDFALFGDYIGGIIGPICALVGIIFLYRTYRIQLDISSTQERIQQKQQFDETFFSLLGQQRNIVVNIKGKFPIGSGQEFEEKTSYEYISQLRKDLADHLQDLNYEFDALTNGSIDKIRNKVNEIYSELFLSHSSQMGHYFRHLYHILKLIKEEREIDGKEYADIVQAQMSYDELYLVAVNGISDYGRKKMLPLLDEYSFLENLAIDDEAIIRRLIELFYPLTKKKYEK